MSTATDEKVDLDVDLDRPVLCMRCEVDSEEREATWRGENPCCHNSALVCDEHKQEYIDIVKFVTALNGNLRPPCGGCKKPFQGVRWTRL